MSVPLAEYARPQLTEREIVEAAQELGYRLTKQGPTEGSHKIRVPKGNRVKIGVVSDTHLGSRFQQLTHLRTFYKWAEDEGCEFFLHCGDLVDGSDKMHRDAPYHLFQHGYKAQRDYAVAAYPHSDLTTYIISGNHDWSFMNGDGGRIVEDVCRERADFTYLGDIGGYCEIGPLRIYLHHPFDGGAYALSYKLQKRIEQVAPNRKPHVWLAGNYHKAAHLPAYRNVEGFLVPSFQSQTPFMQGKGIESVIGGLILELEYDGSGLLSVGTRWRIFYQPIEGDH